MKAHVVGCAVPCLEGSRGEEGGRSEVGGRGKRKEGRKGRGSAWCEMSRLRVLEGWRHAGHDLQTVERHRTLSSRFQLVIFLADALNIIPIFSLSARMLSALKGLSWPDSPIRHKSG